MFYRERSRKGSGTRGGGGGGGRLKTTAKVQIYNSVLQLVRAFVLVVVGVGECGLEKHIMAISTTLCCHGLKLACLILLLLPAFSRS